MIRELLAMLVVVSSLLFNRSSRGFLFSSSKSIQHSALLRRFSFATTTASLLFVPQASASIRVFPSGVQAPTKRMASISSIPPPTSTMRMMKAVVASGGKCVVTQRPVPVPLAGEALVRILYTAANRADTLQRKGVYPPPVGVTDILGLEAVGTVEDIASSSSSSSSSTIEKGQRVMALLSGGGYAEYVTVPSSHLLPIPSSMDFTTAAAIPETWLTAYQLLTLVAHAQKGESVMIHAAGSGVGTAAIQIAKGKGLFVIAVAGTDEKLAVAKTLGADVMINYKKELVDDIATNKIKEATQGKGVNVILDPVGASFWKLNADAIALDGRWVLYGSMGGLSPEGPIMGAILRKRITLLGTTLRSRDDAYKADLVSRFQQEVLPFLANGTFKPVIETEFSLDDAQKAHELMESNANTGKILLKVL